MTRTHTKEKTSKKAANYFFIATFVALLFNTSAHQATAATGAETAAMFPAPFNTKASYATSLTYDQVKSLPQAKKNDPTSQQPGCLVRTILVKEDSSGKPTFDLSPNTPPSTYTRIKTSDSMKRLTDKGALSSSGFDIEKISGFNEIFCSPLVVYGDAEDLTDPSARGLPPAGEVDPVNKIFISAANWLGTGLIYFASWILKLVSYIFQHFLTVSRFMSHPFVQAGWPFIQGITNLGFIFALLFIAVATMLRIDGYGVRRMLPRLLIVALVINFSLYIGAMLIDLSRVSMAIMAFSINQGQDLSDFGMQLLKQTKIAESTINMTFNTNLPNDSWTIPLRLYKIFFTMVIVIFAMGFIAVALLIRYIILLILLVLSPLAYLAFILPGTESLGKKWWSQFFKWVLLGPFLLFFLILITRMGTLMDGEGEGNALINTWIQLAATCTLTVAGGIIAQSMAGRAGGGMLGAIQSKGQSLARRHGTGFSTAMLAGRGVKKGTDKLTKPIQRNWQGYMNERRSYQQNKEKEKRKTEQQAVKSSWGAQLGRSEKFPGYGSKNPDNIKAKTSLGEIRAQNVAYNATTNAGVHNISSEALKDEVAAAQMTKVEKNQLVDRTIDSPAATEGQKIQLMMNKEIVRDIDPDLEADIYSTQSESVKRQYNATRKAIKDEEDKKSKPDSGEKNT